MKRHAAACPLPALLLFCALSARAVDKPVLYAEPAQGPLMTVDNMEKRERMITWDWYCVREILIDGVKVFGGDRCQVKHKTKRSLRLTPGKHHVVFDTISELGDDPDLPVITLPLDVEAGAADFLVLLRDTRKPELVVLDAAVPAASPAKTPAPSGEPASAAAVAGGAAGDPYKALERLKELYDKGVITADEFKEKKTELLKTIR
jgi:hypothetical protein